MNKQNNNQAIQPNNVKGFPADTKQPLEAWETPQLVRLDIDLTAANPPGGSDGGTDFSLAS